MPYATALHVPRDHCLAPGAGRRADRPGGRYGRMFDLPPLEADERLLLELGAAGGFCDGGDCELDARVEAGWPFFGQYVAHDLTADRSPLRAHTDVAALRNVRSARANLESLYGGGPVGSPYLYRRDDPAKLLENDGDLPRNQEGIALIGDPRNDVHEVLHGVIAADPEAYLAVDPGWSPTLPARGETFRLTDLLVPELRGGEVADGKAAELLARGDVEVQEDLAHVVLHRARADEQLCADLDVGEAVRPARPERARRPGRAVRDYAPSPPTGEGRRARNGRGRGMTMDAYDEDDFDGRTGVDLVAELDAGEQWWSLEDGEGVQLWFDDEVAHGASDVLDALVGDLEGDDVPGIARVYREDREVINVEPAPGLELDVDRLAAFVEERLRARLESFGPLRHDDA